MNYKTPESVLVVIYTANLEVLLLERSDHPGWWQSVTGSLEPGETPEQTALREINEETGLIAHNYELRDWEYSNYYEIFACYRHRYAPYVTHNTEYVFGLRLPDRIEITLAPQEHLRYIWLPPQLAATTCFSPSNQAAIKLLPERIL
ncbi:MAG: dihydroneopterin triphosphate diphosphatase [Sulfuriferula sp.]